MLEIEESNGEGKKRKKRKKLQRWSTAWWMCSSSLSDVDSSILIPPRWSWSLTQWLNAGGQKTAIQCLQSNVCTAECSVFCGYCLNNWTVVFKWILLQNSSVWLTSLFRLTHSIMSVTLWIPSWSVSHSFHSGLLTSHVHYYGRTVNSIFSVSHFQNVN